jgi:hypothetical protein
MEIANTSLAPIMEVLIDAAPEFESRGRGPDLAAIFTTLGHVFPEDRHAIITGLGELEQKVRGRVTSRPRVASGKSRDATPKIRRTKIRTNWDDGECVDCPPQGRTSIHENDTTHLQTKEGVLNAFQDNPDILMMHARQLGVNVGNSTKAETIANKIAKYYRDAALQST